MANYAVTTTVFAADTLNQLGTDIETALEAVDSGKTIRSLEIFKEGDDRFRAILIVDT